MADVKKRLAIPKDNYILFHHTGQSFVIPVDPESVADSMGASFASNAPLSRSAPIYSYQNSGPRTVQLQFTLHRDLCNEFNPGEEDMVDALIRCLDEAVLPDYQSAGKIVNPPIVSVKIRDEIYIKGVVQGGITTTFGLPIINYNGADKYAKVSFSFNIAEITPYSASILPSIGKYRRA